MAYFLDTALEIAIPKLTTIDLIGGIFCDNCKITFSNKKDYDNHYLHHDSGTKEIAYTCVVCHSTFDNYPSFRGHCYSRHVIKNRYRCKQCKQEKSFSRLSALKEHISNVHNFKCNKPKCNKQFSSKDELHVHQIIHKNEESKPPYQCQTCNKEIMDIFTCEEHINEHCIFIYNCPICKETITKDDANKHLDTHFYDIDELNCKSEYEIFEEPEDSSINIVGGILCCYCKTLHKNREEIDTHFAEIHPNIKILYTCNICDKQHEQYTRFADHCYNHYSRNRFECSACNKTFPRPSLLVMHAESQCGMECGVCGQRLRNFRALRDHMRGHRQETIVCREPGCGQVLESPLQAMLHRRSHGGCGVLPAGGAGVGAGLGVGVGGLWCGGCGLAFGEGAEGRAGAHQHLLKHRTKMFPCPVCNKQYQEKYLVMKHIPSHFEAILHMCKVCSKTFVARSRLMQHIKTHSSNKKYECQHCEKSFVKPYDLNQHLNIHTGIRPYRCYVCQKTFAGYPNCKKHMIRMHNINPKVTSITVTNDINEINELDFKIDSKVENTTPEVKQVEITTSETILDSEFVNSNVIVDEAQNIDVETLNTIAGTFTELAPILPEELNSDTDWCLSSPGPAMPREYGPDFSDARLAAGAFLDHDDPLPHINPQLLLKPPSPVFNPPIYDYQFESPPIITKVYTGYFGDLDDYKTDIF